MKSRKACHEHCAGPSSFCLSDDLCPGWWGWVCTHPHASSFLLGLANGKPRQELRERHKSKAVLNSLISSLSRAGCAAIAKSLSILGTTWFQELLPLFPSSLGMVKAWLQLRPKFQHHPLHFPQAPFVNLVSVNKTSLNYFECALEPISWWDLD